jgi:hypothetical protein
MTEFSVFPYPRHVAFHLCSWDRQGGGKGTILCSYENTSVTIEFGEHRQEDMRHAEQGHCQTTNKQAWGVPRSCEPTHFGRTREH